MKNKNEQMNDEMKAIAKQFEPRYKSEIEAVKRLGEQIGYGNMMSIASILWSLSLEEKYGITSGAFVPTITGFMHKREADRAEKERELKIQHYKRMGV